MKQEDKELLLKDLCARLLYGIKVLYENQLFDIQYIEPLYYEVKLLDFTTTTVPIRHIKPYLRPMSSMTDEELKEYKHFVAFSGSPDGASNFVDWLNAHHFDYRGLIEKGLAIEVTKDNNSYD